MKLCPKCKLEKEDSEFKLRATGRPVAYCKTCVQEYDRAWHKKKMEMPEFAEAKRVRQNVTRQRVSAWIRAFKENKTCTDCGHTYPSYVLQFDHVKGKKSFNIADAVAKNYSKQRIEEELQLTEIVCANCHAERTHGSKRKQSIA